MHIMHAVFLKKNNKTRNGLKWETFSSGTSGLFKLRNPPLFQIRDKQGGVSYESPRSPKFSPCGGLKIAKTLIFGRFSKFQNPKIFRDKQGGFLMKGGFLNLNTPDLNIFIAFSVKITNFGAISSENFPNFHFFQSSDIENESRTQKSVSKGF